MNHLKRLLALAVFATFAIVATNPASAVTTTKRHSRSARAKLAAEAKVSLKDARATALAKVPDGKVVKHELERENGKLIYSFDIRVPGKPGIEEVQVDAINGDVVSQTHETAKKEKQEARQERMEGKTSSDTTKTGH